MKLGSSWCVVVNDTKSIKEVLITKGAHFDGRPNLKRFAFLFGGDKENCKSFLKITTDSRSSKKGAYLQHPLFFILIYNTLSFHLIHFILDMYFISIISPHFLSSPGFHPVPFSTRLAKMSFHPNLFIPI